MERVIVLKKFLSGITRDLWIMLLDIIAVNAAYFLALMVRLYVNFEWREVARDYYLPAFIRFAPVYTVLVILVFAAFRLYGGMWRYAGMNDMNRIICASAVTAVIQVVGTLFVFTPGGHYRVACRVRTEDFICRNVDLTGTMLSVRHIIGGNAAASKFSAFPSGKIAVRLFAGCLFDKAIYNGRDGYFKCTVVFQRENNVPVTIIRSDDHLFKRQIDLRR